MCNPLAAVAVGSSAIQAIGVRKAARATNARNKAMSEQNQSIIDRDAMATFAGIARRENTEKQAVAGQVRDNRRQILQAQAAARASAAQSGGATIGNSAEAVLNDFEAQRLASLEAARANLDASSSELQAAREAAGRSQEGRSLQNQFVPVDEPNAVTTALQIGAAGVQGYVAGGGTFSGAPTTGPTGGTNAVAANYNPATPGLNVGPTLSSPAYTQLQIP